MFHRKNYRHLLSSLFAFAGCVILAGAIAGCSSQGDADPTGTGGLGNSGTGATNAGTGATNAGTGGDSGGMSTGGSGQATGGQGTGGQVSGEFSDKTSTQLLAEMKLGWNLGNSLDAPESEIAWNNPTVTPELLQAVAAGGFDLVRIPVTWSMHTGAGPDFVIDGAWLDRVEEVVGYAESAGLYAIINLHHDGADAYEGVEWLTLNDAAGAVTDANNLAVAERFTAVWTQIAARFAGHGERLLFESMNEIHDGYDAPDPAYYTIINNLNQTFVDLVRGSGGNNAKRHLVVPGYNTNIDYTLAGFVAPTDPTANRLILSVHYYDPWDFAGAAKTNTWGAASPGADSWGQETHVVTQFDKLKAKFIDAGLPMIIGEYGAVHQAGFEDYRRYYMEYVTKAAHDRGIVPVFWDNGSKESGEEAFGLFDRVSGQSLHPSLTEAMQRAVSSDYSLADIALPAP